MFPLFFSSNIRHNPDDYFFAIIFPTIPNLNLMCIDLLNLMTQVFSVVLSTNYVICKAITSMTSCFWQMKWTPIPAS